MRYCKDISIRFEQEELTLSKNLAQNYPETAFVIDSSAVLRWGAWALACSFKKAVYIIPADTMNELRLAASDSKCEERTDEETAAIDAMTYLKKNVLGIGENQDINIVSLQDCWLSTKTGDQLVIASENELEAIDFAEINCGKAWSQAIAVFGSHEAANETAEAYHQFIDKYPCNLPINRSFLSLTLESRPGWPGWLSAKVLTSDEITDNDLIHRYVMANFGIDGAPAHFAYVKDNGDVAATMRRRVQHCLMNSRVKVLSLGVHDQGEYNVTPEMIKGLDIYREWGFARTNRAIECLYPSEVDSIVKDANAREHIFNHDVRCVIVKDCETLSYPQLVDIINHMQDVPATLVLLYHNDPKKTQPITELNRVYAPHKEFAVVQY